MIQNAGVQQFTADGSVGTSGVAVRVFSLHIISGGTAAIVSLRNGTSSGALAYITQTAPVVSTGNTFVYGDKGILFPAGCFCDVDTNTTSALVVFNYA
jgi:hypothetical protein